MCLSSDFTPLDSLNKKRDKNFRVQITQSVDVSIPEIYRPRYLLQLQ